MTFINNLDPILFAAGPLEVRWYGLFFALGLLLAYLVTAWVFKREKIANSDLDSLVLYLFVGIVVGARLGHVLFYDFAYFFSHPFEILKVWNGGLASHGATIGIALALVIWVKIKKKKFVKYSDLLAIGIALAAAFVRIGNYFNSEIIGKPTNGDWGVVFKRLGEDFPRHPSQIYEAGLSFAIFAIMFWVYKKYFKKLPKWFMSALFLMLYFLTRFFVEMFKERQALPTDFPLSMGQVLSIVPILIAAVYFAFILPKQIKKD